MRAICYHGVAHLVAQVLFSKEYYRGLTMLEVINVRGNSVRVRSGIFYLDVLVKDVNGKKQIELPAHSFYLPQKGFCQLVSIVLSAHEVSNNRVSSNNETNKLSSEIR
jgi:hypothetical protein